MTARSHPSAPNTLAVQREGALASSHRVALPSRTTAVSQRISASSSQVHLSWTRPQSGQSGGPTRRTGNPLTARWHVEDLARRAEQRDRPVQLRPTLIPQTMRCGRRSCRWAAPGDLQMKIRHKSVLLTMTMLDAQ